MKCRELMRETACVGFEAESIGDCIGVMRDEHLPYMLILDGDGDVVGVAAMADLVARAPEGSPARAAHVGTLPSTAVLTCDPHDEPEQVARAMAAANTTLALVAQNRTVLGVLTLDDISRGLDTASGEVAPRQ